MNNKPRVVISDLDNTLFCNDERFAKFSKLLGNGDTEAFHSMEEVLKDKPYDDIIRLLQDLHPWNQIFILTARQQSVDYDVTLAQLDKARVPYDRIIMAPDNDESAADFKVRVYKELKEEYDVWMMLEDNNHCVRALREAGLTILQPRESSY